MLETFKTLSDAFGAAVTDFFEGTGIDFSLFTIFTVFLAVGGTTGFAAFTATGFLAGSVSFLFTGAGLVRTTFAAGFLGLAAFAAGLAAVLASDFVTGLGFAAGLVSLRCAVLALVAALLRVTAAGRAAFFGFFDATDLPTDALTGATDFRAD